MFALPGANPGLSLGTTYGILYFGSSDPEKDPKKVLNTVGFDPDTKMINKRQSQGCLMDFIDGLS